MSTEVNQLEEILRTLTPIQLKYVAQRLYYQYDYQAAEAVGLTKETVSRWPNKEDVDEAIRLMLLDGVKVAAEILRRSLPKAAQELVDELEHKGIDIRHRAALEILDRQLGKPAQPITGEGGGAIRVTIKGMDD